MTARRLPPPRLLPVAAAPVLFAGGVATPQGSVGWPWALLMLTVSLACLVGGSAVDNRSATAWLAALGYFAVFGPVVTLTTLHLLGGQASWPAMVGAVGVGLLAAATQVVAAVRERPDGQSVARGCYVGLVATAFLASLVVAVAHPAAVVALVVAGGAIAPVRTVLSGRMGRGLTPVHRDTAAITLYYAAVLAIAFAVSR